MTASHAPGEHETQADAQAPARGGSQQALTLASQVGNRATGQLVTSGTLDRRLARWDWGDALDVATAVVSPGYVVGKALAEAWNAPAQTPPQRQAPAPTQAPATQPAVTPDTGPQPTQPKPTVEIPTGDWVEGDWVDPDFKGEQKAKDSKATKQELFEAITQVAPHVPRVLRVCMVGQAWVEQKGKGITNFNYFGREGGGTPAYTLAWTSTYVTTKVYEADPDKSKYLDWDFHNHHPKFGFHPDDRGPAGTIDVQISRDPKPKRLVVVMRKPRPAYKSLVEGSASFVHLIQSRVQALRASKDPAHNRLAEQVYAGDPNAYAYMVNSKIVILDAKGKDHGFGAYNDNPTYTGSVLTQIAAAQADLPG